VLKYIHMIWFLHFYKHNLTTYPTCLLSSLFWHIQSSSSKSSSSKSGSGSRDGRGVCGESDGYCKDYDSSSFLNIKKEGGNNKGGDKSSRDDNKSDDKSSKSKSSSSNSKSSSSSGDGSSRTDRCFRACDTDRCTSDDRRRLECPASTAASSDFVQKGQVAATKKLRGRA